MKVQISDIIVKDRYRQDHGDLGPLAESIKEIGLLQPIGITEDNVLVFGERRLLACEMVLKWTEIDARIVNVTSIVAGEFAENEMRKAFTPSERLAIAKAVEIELAGRQGRPKVVEMVPNRAPIPKGEAFTEKVGNRAPFPEGKTRDLAAKASGFSSARQMERAAKVVELGAPAVVEKLDKGEVSISKAADIVNLPKEEQIVALDGAKAAKEERDAAEESLRKEIQHQVNMYGANAYTDYCLKHGKRPDKETAADIGRLVGGRVKADDGSMQPPKSKQQKEADKAARTAQKERNIIGTECARVTTAVANLAANHLDPAVVAKNIDRWQRPHFENFEKAVEWFNKFAEEWRRNGQGNAN